MKKTTRRRETADALSLPDLCRFVHADEDWVIELVEEGVLTPVGSHRGNWRFVGASIVRAKKAGRLSRDLGINAPGLALVLELMEERDAARRRLARYETP